MVGDMKKILLSLTLMAFAVAAQAGDAKSTQPKTKDSKEQAPCCAAATKVSTTATASCPMAANGKMACAAGECKEAPVAKRILLSPKAAGEIARK